MIVNLESQNMMLRKGAILRNAYRVDDYLASGGFGNTYLVTHIALNKQMALKEFFMHGVTHREDNQTAVSVSNTNNLGLFDEQKQKFRKEAQRMHQLVSPNIVKVYDLFDENGTSYYVMDFVNGKALDAWMKQTQRPFPEMQVRSILLQMLNALDVVHKHDMLHMDIKPSNILMDEQGHCTLIDFGSSKQIGPSSTTANTALSYTPGYAPIEQVNGTYNHWGPWTDFYALGATLYHLLTNQKPPFVDEILEKQEGAFNFGEQVSPQMQQLILWMMQPSHGKRPQSSQDIFAFLQNPVQQEGLTQKETTSTNTDQPTDESTIMNDQPLPEKNETTRLQQNEMNGGTATLDTSTHLNVTTGNQQEATKLETAATAQNISAPQQAAGANPAPKKKNGWLWIVLGALLGVGIGVGLFFLLRGGGSSKDSDTSGEPINVAEPTTGVPALEPLNNNTEMDPEEEFMEEFTSLYLAIKGRLENALPDELDMIKEEFYDGINQLAEKYNYEELEDLNYSNQQSVSNKVNEIISYDKSPEYDEDIEYDDEEEDSLYLDY